jgi:RNA polymerase sigma-70 factor, ECF subfamily
VRTWLYRIATNVCLTAIDRRGRRPLPSGLVGPAQNPQAPVVPSLEVPWLQPSGGAYRADAVTVPTVTATGIARIVTFRDPGLFVLFGLPMDYGAAAAPRCHRRP